MRTSLTLMTVHPRDLDVSGEHLLWPGEPSPELARSLEAQGQMTPVLADFSTRRPTLVAGARRVKALLTLRLPALALDVRPDPGEDPDTARALAYLASNQGREHGEARLVAAARYFQGRMAFAGFLEQAGPLLGLDPADRRVRHLRAWLSLPGWMDELLEAGNLPLAGAEALARFPAGDLDALRPYLAAARWSRNHLENVLEWLAETGLARGVGLAEVLAASELPAVLAAELSPADRVNRLVLGARRLRLPRLCALEAGFAGLARTAAAGTNWRIHPSQGFESDAVRLEIRIGDREDLAKAVRDLAAMAERPHWDELWGVARAGEDE